MTRKTRTSAVPLRLYERVGYRFSIITKRLHLALADMHSRQFGISVNNWKIISVIDYFAPLSSSELGARTSLDSDKVSRAVDTLVGLGYVVRERDKIDRRKVTLRLSALGKRVHDKIERTASELEIEFLGVLSTTERAALQHTLTKLEQHSAVLFARGEGRIDGRVEAPAVSAAVRPFKKARDHLSRKVLAKRNGLTARPTQRAQ